MKVSSYLQSVLPNFERSKIVNDLSAISAEYTNITIPAYKNTVGVFKDVPLKDDQLVIWDEQFSKVSKYKVNMFETIYKTIQQVPEMCDTLSDLVHDYFAKDVLSGAMSYTRLSLLQYTEMVRFVSMYSRRFLLMALTLTTDKIESNQIDRQASRDYKYLLNRFDDFVKSIGIIVDTGKKLDKKIDKIPELDVTADSASAQAALNKASSLDPFGFGFIAVRFNPIYHVRMAVANWQLKQYELAKEEKVALELKLHYLKQSSEGKASVKMAKTISYTEGRIEDLQYDIDKVEHQYD